MADIIITPGSSIMSFTSSANYTQTITQDASGSLILQGSGSTGRTDLFTVNGNNGTLFSVSDDLSDSLFSVNTIAGLPVIEAFANNTVTLGQYGQNVLVVTGSSVSIGSADNAGAKLRVNGTSLFDGEQSIYYTNATQTMVGSTGYSLFRMYGNSNGVEVQLDAHSSNSAAGTVGTFSNSDFFIKSNNTSRIAVKAGGNVGIGTTNPVSELHVQGTSTEQISVSYDSTRRMIVGRTTGYGWILPYTSGVSYDNLVLARDGGYVGIGTTSPSNKLTVYQDGGVRVTGITNGSYIEISGDLPGYSANSYPVIKSGGTIHFANNGKYAGYLEGSNTYFGILDSGQTTRVFLNTGGNSYFTGGNVGIGTTSPGSKLQVETGADGSVLYLRGTSGNTTDFGFDTVGGYVETNGSSTARQKLRLQTYNGSAYTQLFIDGGNQYIYTSNNVNVGIGTSSPATLHHVYGSGNTFTRYTNTSNSGHYVDVGANSGGQSFIYGYGAYPLWFGTNGSTEMTILSGGNVGIGNTAPNTKLEISVGNGNTGGLRINYASTATSEGMDITYLNTGATVTSFDSRYNSNNAAMQFRMKTAGTPVTAMTILGTGYIGIGTTNPGYQLEVNGWVGASRYYPYSSNSTYIDGDTAGMRVAGSGYLYVAPSGGSYFEGPMRLRNSLSNDQNAYLQINGGTSNITYFNGTVGIGITNPVAGLDNQASNGIYRQRGLTTMVTDSLNADGTQAKRYEIARATIDYNDWNETGPIEIELYEKYYADGCKKKYSLSYGYQASGAATLRLTQMDGYGANNFQVTVGSPVTISGDDRYLPIYVDVRYYGRVVAVVKTTRTLTTSNPPGQGGIWLNNAPSGTNISDFTADSTVIAGNANGGYTAFIAGNVGIGTTGPGYPLHVYTSDSSANVIGVSNGTQTLTLGVNNSSGGSFLFENGNNALRFGTNGSERMRITAAGDVGIGTTNPAVVSNYKTLTLDATSGTFTEYRQGGTNILRVGVDGSRPFLYGDTNAPMDFFTNGSFKMRIATDGNVGIGTTDAAGQMSGTIGLAISHTNYPSVGFKNSTTSWLWYGVSSNLRMWNASYGDILTATTDGRIGIGTDSPSVKFQINAGSSDGIILRTTSNAEPFIALQRNSANSGVGVFRLQDGGALYFDNGATGAAQSTKMAILANGTVGIGTTDPGGYNLSVNGSTRVVGSIIGQDSSNNTRYEFAPNLAYTLVGVASGLSTYKINSGAASLTSMLRMKSSSTYGWLEGIQRYFNGTVISDGLCAEVISTAGTLVFLTSDAEWGIADADVVAKSTSLLGIALNATSNIGDTVHVMIDGIISLYSNHDQLATPITPGAPIYVSTTGGNVTQTAPSGTGDVVRLVGHNIWGTTSGQDVAIIRFQPDATWIEI